MEMTIEQFVKWATRRIEALEKRIEDLETDLSEMESQSLPQRLDAVENALTAPKGKVFQ